jgi:hypothetical protein
VFIKHDFAVADLSSVIEEIPKYDLPNGILPLPAVLGRKLRKPASFHQILLEPAFGH